MSASPTYQTRKRKSLSARTVLLEQAHARRPTESGRLLYAGNREGPRLSKAYVGLADSYNLLREFAAMPEPELIREPGCRAESGRARRQLRRGSRLVGIRAGILEVGHCGSGARVPPCDSTRPRLRRGPSLVRQLRGAHRAFRWSLNEINRAEQIDPGSNAVLADKALILFYLGRLDEAIVLAKKVEASQPNFLLHIAIFPTSTWRKAMTRLRRRSHEGSGLVAEQSGSRKLHMPPKTA